MGILSKLGSLFEPNTSAKVNLCQPSYLNRHHNRVALILATGPSIKQCWPQVDQLRRKTNAITLGANNITSICVPDYHCFTNRKRCQEFANTIDSNRSRVLMSPYFHKRMIKEHYKGSYEEVMYINDNDREFDIVDGVIQASCRTTGVLLIAIAIVMGMKQIFLAGMDGYSDLLPRGGSQHHYDKQNNLSGATTEAKHRLLETEKLNAKFMQEISIYMKNNGTEPFTIVTPTVHKQHYRSFDDLRI